MIGRGHIAFCLCAGVWLTSSLSHFYGPTFDVSVGPIENVKSGFLLVTHWSDLPLSFLFTKKTIGRSEEAVRLCHHNL